MIESVPSHRDEGLRLLQSGDPDGAISRFRESLTENPEDAVCLGLLGVCYARRGESEQAVDAMQHSVRLAPGDAMLRYNLALALYHAHHFPEARVELAATLALDPDHSRARVLADRLQEAPQASEAPGEQVSDLAAQGPERTAASSAPADPPSPEPAAEPAAHLAPVSLRPATPGARTLEAIASLETRRSGREEDADGGESRAAALPETSASAAPELGQRVRRGWIWGAAWGQCWSVGMILWSLASGMGAASDAGGLAQLVLSLVLVYGIFGAITGAIIGMSGGGPRTSAGIGIGAGFVCFGIYFLISHNAAVLPGVLFFTITGLVIGRRITRVLSVR